VRVLSRGVPTEQEDLRIQNVVLKQLMKAGLSGTEWVLVLAVIQRENTQDENVVSISLREFHELVCVDQEAIRKGLKSLRRKNILVQEESPSFRQSARWSFNADCGTWVPANSKRVPCQHTLPQQHTESPTPAQGTVLHEHTLPLSTDPTEISGNNTDAGAQKPGQPDATMFSISTTYREISNHPRKRVCRPKRWNLPDICAKPCGFGIPGLKRLERKTYRPGPETSNH
jgi:hypothetical protein